MAFYWVRVFWDFFCHLQSVYRPAWTWPSVVGLAHGVAWFAVAGFSLPAGWLGRRYDQRKLIMWGIIASVFAFALIPVTELFPKSVWAVWIAVANGMAGLFGSVFMVNGPPFLMSNTIASERDHAFSVQTAAIPLFGFGGNLMAGFLPGLISVALSASLDRPAPYRYPLLLVPVSCAVASIIILSTTTVPHVHRAEVHIPSAKTESSALGLIL